MARSHKNKLKGLIKKRLGLFPRVLRNKTTMNVLEFVKDIRLYLRVSGIFSLSGILSLVSNYKGKVANKVFDVF